MRRRLDTDKAFLVRAKSAMSGCPFGPDRAGRQAKLKQIQATGPHSWAEVAEDASVTASSRLILPDFMFLLLRWILTPSDTVKMSTCLGAFPQT